MILRTNLKIAWRNVLKHKGFSAINVVGLSIGMTVCIIISLFVRHELSYDRFHKNAERIVRIVFNASINGGKISESNVMPPVADALKKEYPEVEDATRLRKFGNAKVTYADKVIKDLDIAFTDPNFFSIFSFPFITGDRETALSQPNSVIITREAAVRIFGREDPMGKTLSVGSNPSLYKVTGVLKNLPDNSHFHFDIFVSMTGLEESTSDSWMVSNFFTYALLRPGTNYKALQGKLPQMVQKYMGPQIQQSMGLTLAQFQTKGSEFGFALQPVTDIHLYSHTTSELEAGGNVVYVQIFAAIALFMLLIACINFINLSTASATRRAKEVGVLKVIGSGKWRLVGQFLLESGLLVFVALLLSAVLAKLSLPVFNELSGKELSFYFDGRIIAILVGLGLLVTLIAGSYPAFVLASFRPAAVLKGNLKGNNKSFGLRSALVVFQFFISVVLIVGTIVVYQQMKYIQNKALGYQKEQLLVLPNSSALGNREQVFRDRLKADPRIVNVTMSRYKPAGPTNSNNALAYPEGKDDQMMRTLEYHVDEEYIPTLGMQLAAGRNFSKEYATDSTAMIINQSAARAFGWTDNAIGKVIIRENSIYGHNVPFHIIGIVKDFHFKSLHEPITPLLMTLQPESGLIVRIKTANLQGLLASLRQTWDEFGTDEPFTYAFMDELYSQTYAAEQTTGRILNILTVLTLLVACLGLFGLTTYTAEQRTKEISIRKVVGASVSDLTAMLSANFLKLVCLSCLIALPLSYWLMNWWLQSFAYRVAIEWWMLAIATLVALLIALATVSYQAIKTALANPVKSLRAE